MRANERRIRLAADVVVVGGGDVAVAARRVVALEATERRVELVGWRLTQLEREAGDLRVVEGAEAGREQGGMLSAVSGAAFGDDSGMRASSSSSSSKLETARHHRWLAGLDCRDSWSHGSKAETLSQLLCGDGRHIALGTNQ